MTELAQTGSALSHEHTLKYLYAAEVWKPRLAMRQGLVGGAPAPQTSLDRARAETRKLIETYQVEPLAEDVQAEIDEILDTYDRARTIR
jgi:hypothetical protein